MAFLHLLYVASMPIVKILLVSACGIILSTQSMGVLTDRCLTNLNKIVYVVFTPALLFSSLAESVTLEDLISWWSMPVNVFFTVFFGAMLGKIVIKITDTPEDLQGVVVANCCAANMGSLLLIVVPSLCDDGGSLFGETTKCKLSGEAYVSFSMGLGSFFMWTYAYSLIRESSCLGENVSENGVVEKIPNIDCGNSDEKSTLPQGTFLFPHDLCSEEYPSNKQNKNSKMQEIIQNSIIDVAYLILHELKEPPTFSVITGLLVGAISGVKTLFVSKSAPLRVVQDTICTLGNGTVPSTILVLGGNLLKGLKSSRLKPLTVVLVMCVKFILLPATGTLIVRGASCIGLVPNDPLYKFVLMIQYAGPPAMNIGIMCQLLNVGKQECAVLFFWTYLVASIALTLWSTVFMLLLVA